MPVILPPPPEPAPVRESKALPTRAKEAQSAEGTEQKSPPATEVQSTDPSPPPASIGTVSNAPPPRTPETTTEAKPQPPRRSSQEKPDPPIRSAPVITADTEEPGEPIIASKSDVAEGRTLLRLLEYGSGPLIELAWPDAPGHREDLFSLFSQCYGMQVALMDAVNRLYVAEGPPNAPWIPNLDRFSGFIRAPAGEMSRQERQAAERIHAYHGGLVSTTPVRVFPRAVDARLLGGLRRLVGESYAGAQTIRAQYRLSGRRLVVERIVADGRPFQGRLELPPVARRTCRGLA